MTDLRVSFETDKLGRTYKRSTERNKTKVLASMRATAEAVRLEVITRGRADIREASPAFAKSKRWAPGFDGKVTEGGGVIKTTFTHKIKYWTVHQFGAIIKAKNKTGLLWIPLDFAKDAQGVMARDFPEPLFRVNRAGKAPLLMTVAEKQPKYFGVPSVKIPKRFHIYEIIREVTRQTKDFYRKAFAGGFGTQARG